MPVHLISTVARLKGFQSGVREAARPHAASMNMTQPVRSIAAWTISMI